MVEMTATLMAVHSVDSSVISLVERTALKKVVGKVSKLVAWWVEWKGLRWEAL